VERIWDVYVFDLMGRWYMLRCLNCEGEVLRTAKGFIVGVVRLFLETLQVRN
jgi:hypothetical protein